MKAYLLNDNLVVDVWHLNFMDNRAFLFSPKTGHLSVPFSDIELIFESKDPKILINENKTTQETQTRS